MLNNSSNWNLNSQRKKDENIFSLPAGLTKTLSPKKLGMKYRGLKPNTRYKITIDNNPGSQFEDITRYSSPVGLHKLRNLPSTKEQKVKRTFIKTDERGDIDLNIQPYSTDVAKISAPGTFTPPHRGTPIPSSCWDFSSYWENYGDRHADDDKGRGKIKIIEYSDVLLPDSDDVIKEVPNPGDSVPTDIPSNTKTDPMVPINIGGTAYQTFYVDAKSVADEECVDILDITLYFRRKPRRKNNLSGLNSPAASITLLKCKEDGTPDPTQAFLNGTVNTSWSNIQASSTAEIGTVFTFETPIRVQTNQSYAFAIRFQDQDYILWENTKGELLLVNGARTEKRSTGSTKEHLGDMYEPKSFSKSASSTNNIGELDWSANKAKDVKFDVHVARYKIDDVSVDMCLKDYEFIKIANTTNRWAPAEQVYKDVTPFAGTSAITAGKSKIVNNGSANFSGLVDGDKLVMIDSTDDSLVEVFTVDTSLFSPTATEVLVEEISEFSINGSCLHTVVAEVDFFSTIYDTLRLTNSSVTLERYTANNDYRFAEGDRIIGVDSFNSGVIQQLASLPISIFRPNFNGEIPPKFDVDTKYNFSVFVESSNTYSLQTDDTLMYLNAPNHIRGYESIIMSRSLEVATSGLEVGSNKSATFNMSYNYTGPEAYSFCCPQFSTDSLQILTHRWGINNSSADEYKSDNTGAAVSKMVSKKLVLGAENMAEDLKVIANVHTPVGTSVEMYARVYNSNDPTGFNNKQWTKMLQIAGHGIYDDPEQGLSFHEGEWQIPWFPTSNGTVEGIITTVENSKVLTFDASANTTQIDALAQGQVIKLYSTLFPTVYQLFSVDSANSAALTVTMQQPVSNTSMVGDGFRMDTLIDENTAFRNTGNFEISRYFGNDGEIYDNFDQVAVKIVLLSTGDKENVVPKVMDYRVIGVSA